MTARLRQPGQDSGQCQRCAQVRPLWRYRVQHLGEHVADGDSFEDYDGDCRWCDYDAGVAEGAPYRPKSPQPLLCPRCYSGRAEAELADRYDSELVDA